MFKTLPSKPSLLNPWTWEKSIYLFLIHLALLRTLFWLCTHGSLLAWDHMGCQELNIIGLLHEKSPYPLCFSAIEQIPFGIYYYWERLFDLDAKVLTVCRSVFPGTNLHHWLNPWLYWCHPWFLSTAPKDWTLGISTPVLVYFMIVKAIHAKVSEWNYVYFLSTFFSLETFFFWFWTHTWHIQGFLLALYSWITPDWTWQTYGVGCQTMTRVNHIQGKAGI